MSYELLSNIWFFLLALVWAIYLCQELFVTGAGILSLKYLKNKEKHQLINKAVGTHWDGIEVWIILAIGGLFAAFPLAYGTLLSSLYIPFYLLLTAIILRGTAIELIYKTDNIKIQNIMKWMWSIGSVLLLSVLGIYFINYFIGLPIVDGHMNDTFGSFLFIFNSLAFIGLLFFLCSGVIFGYLFLNLYTTDSFTEIKKVAKITSLFTILLSVVIILSFNNTYEIFNLPNGLYQNNYIYYILPLLMILGYLFGSMFIWLEKNLLSFISFIIGVFSFIFTGYTAMFPYIIRSTESVSNGILINEASSGEKTLLFLFIVILIFLPIVLTYQTYKYIKFWR